MKVKAFVMGGAFAMALATPAGAVIWDTQTGIGLEPDGIEFMNGLYYGYEALSQDRYSATDAVDAEHFNHKARRAYRRSATNPDEIMDRTLSEADAAELQAALDRIRYAWDRGGRYTAPSDAAEAQVAYDCWIEAAERTNPDTAPAWRIREERDDVERCKTRFMAAIERVEAAATFALTEARKPAPPEPEPMPMAAPKPFIIYFAWDSAVLTSAGSRIVDEAVAAARELGVTEYTVTGHADRSGPEDYNLRLSLRRANAVRDALVARGVAAGDISVAGRGEAEPAVPTADGVREPANRRVEIILL